MQCAYYPHSRVQTDPGGPSLAKQSFKDQCDISTIMKKYYKTGLLDHVAKFGGYYGDLPDDVDYQSAINKVRDAEAAFGSLTADIRSRFENDPAQFLAFVQDEENAPEIIALGLGPPPSSEPAPGGSKADPAPDAGEGDQASEEAS